MLVSLDAAAGREDHRQRALAATVAARELSPLQAWPEYFAPPQDEEEAVPSADADMSGWQWEEATQESAEADLAAILAANQTVQVPDQDLVTTRPPLTGDLEWT